ncbi:hypothetical protein Anas_01562 [Armadillidium nasatum]|uniref:Uncharacterized protein n=1 Tax=Armadillidium nasatum TaxID=96803 RepID=A0A5N5ST10_9CRUS|nr:hypothetical protein Anas_01562 [Armadillidium nasatum]
MQAKKLIVYKKKLVILSYSKYCEKRTTDQNLLIFSTKKEKAHKCLKPKLRNYQQNRVKRFVINQENLNYQSSVWRNEPTSESANY